MGKIDGGMMNQQIRPVRGSKCVFPSANIGPEGLTLDLQLVLEDSSDSVVISGPEKRRWSHSLSDGTKGTRAREYLFDCAGTFWLFESSCTCVMNEVCTYVVGFFPLYSLFYLPSRCNLLRCIISKISSSVVGHFFLSTAESACVFLFFQRCLFLRMMVFEH